MKVGVVVEEKEGKEENMTPERKKYLEYGVVGIPTWEELSEDSKQRWIEYNKAWADTR
jgi:hypothetical protein